MRVDNYKKLRRIQILEEGKRCNYIRILAGVKAEGGF
jgi:hypothetical protein